MTRRRPRTRFWFEVAGFLVTAFAFVLTLVAKDWLETVFGIDPDQGNGTAEWAIVVASLMAAVVCAACARVEWRRAAHPALTSG